MTLVRINPTPLTVQRRVLLRPDNGILLTEAGISGVAGRAVADFVDSFGE